MSDVSEVKGVCGGRAEGQKGEVGIQESNCTVHSFRDLNYWHNTEGFIVSVSFPRMPGILYVLTKKLTQITESEKCQYRHILGLQKC